MKFITGKFYHITYLDPTKALLLLRLPPEKVALDKNNMPVEAYMSGDDPVPMMSAE